MKNINKKTMDFSSYLPLVSKQIGKEIKDLYSRYVEILFAVRPHTVRGSDDYLFYPLSRFLSG